MSRPYHKSITSEFGGGDWASMFFKVLQCFQSETELRIIGVDNSGDPGCTATAKEQISGFYHLHVFFNLIILYNYFFILVN